MDAEKFDKVVLDLLYDELDELTRASAIRHTEQSGRAKAIYAELRATREVGVLPLVEPPVDLERRILEAEQQARAERPLRQRIGAFISIAASYAMRPQLGMAAVLLLMVGSSLLLLRVKPGAPSAMQVTERGVPESDKETVAVPVPEPAAPAAAAPSPEPERGVARREAARAEATEEKSASNAARAAPAAPTRDFDALEQGAPSDSLGADKAKGRAASGGFAAPPPAAAAPAADDEGALADDEPAKREREGSGCASSLPHYEQVIAHPPSVAAGEAARFAAADCYVRLGRVASARNAYTSLLSTATYGSRARDALASLSPPSDVPQAAAPASPAGAAKAGAAEPPAASPPAKPSAP